MNTVRDTPPALRHYYRLVVFSFWIVGATTVAQFLLYYDKFMFLAGTLPGLFWPQLIAIIAAASPFIISPHNAASALQSGIQQVPGRWFLLTIAVSSILISLIEVQLLSVVYISAFVAFFLFFVLVWTLPVNYRTSAFRGIALVMIIATVVVVARFYPPDNRWFGGVSPNLLGQAMIVIAAFGAMTFRTLRWPIVMFCLAIAILVSSRFAIVSILLIACILASYVLSRRARMEPRLSAFVVAFLATLVILIAHSLGLIDAVFVLDDPYRGLTSGLTGREDTWALFPSQILQKPLTGFGFRARGEYIGAHNGYLNILLENGIILGSAMISYILFVLITSARRAFGGYGGDDALVFVLVAVTCVSGLFQPQILNLGDAGGISFLFALAYPRSGSRSARQSIPEREALSA